MVEISHRRKPSRLGFLSIFNHEPKEQESKEGSAKSGSRRIPKEIGYNLNSLALGGIALLSVESQNANTKIAVEGSRQDSAASSIIRPWRNSSARHGPGPETVKLAAGIKNLDNIEDLDYMLQVVQERKTELAGSRAVKKKQIPGNELSKEEDPYLDKLRISPSASPAGPTRENYQKPSNTELHEVNPSPPSRVRHPLPGISSLGLPGASASLKRSKPYQYVPLSNERQIRLLSVSIDEKSVRFSQYAMITISLNDQIPFETVSYVWGKDTRDHRLNLSDGTYIMVNSNLFIALPELSKHCTTGYLWIDQLCIDQSNTSERNHQVKTMGDIYRRGSGVFVFLGTETDLLSPTRATSVNQLVDITTASESMKNTTDDLQALLSEHIRPQTGDLHYQGKRHWTSVVEIFKHAWFQRAWVFQEVVLSEAANFIVGNRVVPFDILFRLAQATNRIEIATLSKFEPGECITALPGFYNLYAMAQGRAERALLTRPRDFWQLLSEIAPNSQCSDAKDVVYAFLGLLEDVEVSVQPDYDLQLNEVFIMTARSFVTGKKNLEVFGFVPRDDGVTHSTHPDVPTWAPQWGVTETVMSFTTAANCPFDASAGRPYIPNTLLSPLQVLEPCLTVKGKAITSVVHVFGRFESDEHWATRNIEGYLRLFLINKRLNDLNFLNLKNCTPERLLRVMLADGVLLVDGPGTQPTTPLSEKRIRELTGANLSYLVGNTPHPELLALRNLSRIAMGRLIFITADGRIGLAHQTVLPDDMVCILHGSKTPVVLAKSERGTYQTKGQCYLEGAMYGEEVNWKEDEADEFVLY